MWDLLNNIVFETAKIFNDLSFYLIIGLFFAGVIKQFVPTEFLIKHLGNNDFPSVLKASLIGVPLPLCSCSVLPTAIALRKKGASSGATASFLISTPETGVDSISLTYALLDPIFTIFRPVAAFLTAMICGSSVNFLENKDLKNKPVKKSAGKKKSTAKDEKYSEIARSALTKDGLLSIFKYGYSRLLGEIAGWLLFGIILAGVIGAVTPDDFFSTYLNDPLLSMLVMIVIGVPIYICATGSTPIAAALITKGLNPGAALVFLLVGPATNIGSFFVLRKYIKKKYIFAYLASLIVVSLILGFIINLFYGPDESPVKAADAASTSGLPGSIKLISSVILIFFLGRALYMNRTFPALKAKSDSIIKKLRLNPKTVTRVLISLLITAYILSGFILLTIGETAIVKSFGNVTDVITKPGLYYRLPYPINKITKQSHREIYKLEIGFRSTGTLGDALLNDTEEILNLDSNDYASDIPEIGTNVPEEGFVFSGDENIVDLDATFHYRVIDPYKYLYNWKPDENVIRSIILASIRRVVNRIDIMSVLVDKRDNLTKKIEKEVEELLNKLDLGIELMSLNLTNIHAPGNVHYYFRDVASSMEDRQKMINNAERYALDTTIRSRGEAIAIKNKSEAYNIEEIAKAEREAISFRARYLAYLTAPEITRFRIYIETVETALAKVKGIFLLKFNNPSAVDFWLNMNEKPVYMPYKTGEEN